MELNVNEVVVPERIEWNYEQLKAELAEKVHVYETMVYTEDQIKEAKADRAQLNRLKKLLNDERLRREREYMRPFNEFKTQVAEVISIIDKPIAVIDAQVKEYEEQKKQEKNELIWQFWNGIEHPAWLDLTHIMSDRWLNAGVSMKHIQGEIFQRLERVDADLEVIANLPEFAFEAGEVYRATLDLNKAVSEGRRLADIQRRKREAEERAAMEAEKKVAPDEDLQPQGYSFPQTGAARRSVDDGRMWVMFEARMNRQEALRLRDFFDENGITFRSAGR